MEKKMTRQEFEARIKEIDDRDGVGMGVAVLFFTNGIKIISQTLSIDCFCGGYFCFQSVKDEAESVPRKALFVDVRDVQDYSIVGRDLSC